MNKAYNKSKNCRRGKVAGAFQLYIYYYIIVRKKQKRKLGYFLRNWLILQILIIEVIKIK